MRVSVHLCSHGATFQSHYPVIKAPIDLQGCKSPGKLTQKVSWQLQNQSKDVYMVQMKMEKHAKLILLKNTIHQSYSKKPGPSDTIFQGPWKCWVNSYQLLFFCCFFSYKLNRDSVFVHVFIEDKINAWLSCSSFQVSLSINEFTDETSPDPE